MAAKAIVSVGDLHCGSLYGLLPEGFEAGDGTILQQNVAQKYLWKCWTHFCGRVKEIAPSVVAVVGNGDLVEGVCPKSRGGETSLIRSADQCRAAQGTIELLLDAATTKTKRPKLFLVAGTDYHVGDVARDEESIAQAMGAERYHGPGVGHRLKQVLTLDVDGVILNWAHHISFAPVNKHAPIAKEIRGALGAELHKNPHLDAIIRNHVHVDAEVREGKTRGFTSPCWQLQTNFGRKGGLFRVELAIGGIILWIDPEAKKRGQCPVTGEVITYPLPPMPVNKL